MKATLVFLTLLAASSALAGQGVVLSPGQILTFPINNSAPYTSISSSRVELRIHNWAQAGSFTNVVSLPGLQVRFSGTGYPSPLVVTDWLDSFTEGQGNSISLNIVGMSDVILRVQRDTAAMTFNVQVWSANGTGATLTASLPIDAIGIATLPTQAQFGDLLTNGILDYLRWYSAAVPVATGPASTPGGDLADFELERNLTDASAQHSVVAATLPLAYSGAPLYGPVCSQGPQRILRAGVPQVLHSSGSYSLNGNPQLSYKWTQVSGPNTLVWNSTTSATPTITGLEFGSYTIKLTVTDSSGQSSANTIKYGSVNTDSKDVVITQNHAISAVFGPMLRLGASPWPYFDTSHQQLADFFGGLQSTDYLDVWNTAQAGTITVTNGSATVTGVNTTFQSTFCGGGNFGVNGASVIVWYPVPNSPGQFGRAPYGVASCESDTSLTLGLAFVAAPSAGNLSYAFMDNNKIGTWINGSSNANYYDNVMAFYNLYYRSGLDDYLNYARTLADRWYSMPWFDQGRASQFGFTTLLPRMQALTGLMLRALDGHPDYWPGIEQYLAWDYAFVNNPPIGGYALGDIREEGYATAYLALASMLDQTPGYAAIAKTELQTAITNVWAPAVQPSGNWVNSTNGYSSWNGGAGTVSVVNGSTTVTGTNTNWQQAWFTGNAFWTADPNGVTHGDTTSYIATFVSPNQLTLNIPYQGPSASGRGWEANSLVGVGTQPFMLGVVGQALHFANEANADSRLPALLTGVQQWLATEGYRPDSRGLWYGRTFPNCEPISPNNAPCSGGTVEQSRFLAGEIIGAVSAAYLNSGDPNIKAFGDNIFGAMFGGPTGGPDSDSTYINDIGPGGWATQTKYAKDFGFFFGFGGGPSWLAARLNPKAPGPVPHAR